ncbi:MAG: complex I subunit 5 family protein [Bacillota bacterium]
MIYIPVLLILIPIVTAMVRYLFHYKRIGYMAFIAQAIMSVLAILYYFEFNGNYDDTLFVFGGWNRDIGISLENDALSMSFIFLTIFSWWMVLLYTFDYKKDQTNFLFFLLFLEGVFMGLLQTNDLFNMFVFLELTTILVTILIAYKKTGESFKAAIYYLLLNTAGVLAFLMGIILIYFTFGTININVITEMMHESTLAQTTIIRFSYALMIVGISVKTALFPVFTWLPRAHGVAQSGISALLSGLIVKAGLYLFIRINQMFSGADYDTATFFFVIGATTALVGVMFALTQKDIKQILAYHTVSQVGIMMMGLSSSDLTVFYGGVMHIFNHALFKSLLFLGAGIIISVYRTKKVSEIRGVFRTMPGISIFMIIGMLSITGAPLFNGFISKSIIKYGLTDIEYYALFLVNIGTATSFVKMSQIFFGPKTLSYPMKEISKNIALMSLALLCVILGSYYIPVIDGFFGINVTHIKNFSFSYLFDYGVTIGIGFLIYYFIVKKDPKPVRKIRNFTISFETANIFFIILLVVLTTYFVLIPIR